MAAERPFPSTRFRDLLRLATGVAVERLRRRRRADVGGVVCRWVRDTATRHDGGDLILDLGFKRLLLVNDRRTSDYILGGLPGADGYVEGPSKRKAMAFLAPNALTIQHGTEWKSLRSFNERVLCTGAEHDHARAFLNAARAAFQRPVRDLEDIRDAMGATMLDVVFGPELQRPELRAGIETLFGVVKNPLKRGLLGFWYARRRRRFYAALRRCWEEADANGNANLLTLARRSAPAAGDETLLQQVPHWMFTFTGSGTDLLYRALALLGSRPEAYERAEREIAAAGPLDAPETVGRLRFLESCLLETGRLFPPVTLTFHSATKDDEFEGRRIPAGTEIVHYFPLLHRGVPADEQGDEFRPERWLAEERGQAPVYSNLFLSGPRACPGRDLLLFVAKSALARQITEHGIRCDGATSLSADPLPVSFPGQRIRFQTREDT